MGYNVIVMARAGGERFQLSRCSFGSPHTVLALREPPASRRNLRSLGGSVDWNVEQDRVAGALPVRNYGYAIAELNQTIRTGSPVVIDDDAAASKGMAMREGEAHVRVIQATGRIMRRPRVAE